MSKLGYFLGGAAVGIVSVIATALVCEAREMSEVSSLPEPLQPLADAADGLDTVEGADNSCMDEEIHSAEATQNAMA